MTAENYISRDATERLLVLLTDAQFHYDPAQPVNERRAQYQAIREATENWLPQLVSALRKNCPPSEMRAQAGLERFIVSPSRYEDMRRLARKVEA